MSWRSIRRGWRWPWTGRRWLPGALLLALAASCTAGTDDVEPEDAGPLEDATTETTECPRFGPTEGEACRSTLSCPIQRHVDCSAGGGVSYVATCENGKWVARLPRNCPDPDPYDGGSDLDGGS